MYSIFQANKPDFSSSDTALSSGVPVVRSINELSNAKFSGSGYVFRAGTHFEKIIISYHGDNYLKEFSPCWYIASSVIAASRAGII